MYLLKHTGPRARQLTPSSHRCHSDSRAVHTHQSSTAEFYRMERTNNFEGSESMRDVTSPSHQTPSPAADTFFGCTSSSTIRTLT